MREVNADEKRQRRRESGGPGRETGGSKRRQYLPVVKVKTKRRTSIRGSTVKGGPHWHSPGEGEWALDRKGDREGSRRPFGVDADPPHSNRWAPASRD